MDKHKLNLIAGDNGPRLNGRLVMSVICYATQRDVTRNERIIVLATDSSDADASGELRSMIKSRQNKRRPGRQIAADSMMRIRKKDGDID